MFSSLILPYILKNSPADRNLGSHFNADTPLHSNLAGQDSGLYPTSLLSFEALGPRDSHDRKLVTESFHVSNPDHSAAQLHRDEDIVDGVPGNAIATTKAVQEPESALPSHNAKSNLPPWLRTQSQNGPTSQSSSVANKAPVPMTQKPGQVMVSEMSTSTYPTVSVAQRTKQDQPVPSTQLSHEESANFSAPASGLTRGPSSNLSTLAGPGQMPNASSGHMFLPAMAQCSSLPIMTGGPLIPNSQPNSSFVRTNSGPMRSSAAQRLFPPGAGLLGGNLAQDFQIFNNPGILQKQGKEFIRIHFFSSFIELIAFSDLCCLHRESESSSCAATAATTAAASSTSIIGRSRRADSYRRGVCAVSAEFNRCVGTEQ
jgi:hypothetical protein